MRLMTLFVLALSLAAAQTTVTLDSQGTISMQPWMGKTRTAERTVEIPGHYYVVRYEYNTAWSTVPATYPPGQSHYGANISVFEVVNGSKQQIGVTVGGQYTENGCFEDKPETLIKAALKSVDRLTPEIETLFDERDRKVAFEAMPQFETSDGVLTITERGKRDLKAIVIDGKAIWGKIPERRVEDLTWVMGGTAVIR